MRRLAAATAALALVASACGGNDGGDAASPGQRVYDEGVREGLRERAEEREVERHPTSMEEWEALWEEQRAAVIERIRDEGWGLSEDGNTLTGPEGFTVDLTQCPAGWNNLEGLTDTEIRIGHTTAQSGTLADYGNMARTMQVMFDDQNAKGGIGGRRINFMVRDDGYDVARTIPLISELIDNERVFMMITLGSPATMRTYGMLNQRCIPQPWSMTGHPAWGDPENHPWTWGLHLAYTTEALMWGTFIEERIDELAPDGGTITVAGLVMNNDFGLSYDFGFRGWLDNSDIADRINYVTERIEPAAPTIRDAMTTLQFQNPDVFIAMTAGVSCTQAITDAADSGMKDEVAYLFQPSTCAALTFIGADRVGGDGSASDGWWVVNAGLKDLLASEFDNDAFVVFARDQLTRAGIDYHQSANFGTGYQYGWPVLQNLLIANELEGGLNRANFVLAARAMQMTHPYLLEGIVFGMNGNADAYPIEGGIYQQFNAANQNWENRSEVIDLSGISDNCSWDQAAGTCR